MVILIINSKLKFNINCFLAFIFINSHYAGDVVYNIYGFLEKNKDTLFQDFKRLLYSSKNPIIRDMWPEGALDIKSVSNIT